MYMHTLHTRTQYKRRDRHNTNSFKGLRSPARSMLLLQPFRSVIRRIGIFRFRTRIASRPSPLSPPKRGYYLCGEILRAHLPAAAARKTRASLDVRITI